MNPMIRKELRQRMRERRAWLLLSLYLAALSGAVALGYFFETNDWFGFNALRQPQGAEIGITVFLWVTYTQLSLLLLLAPVFTAGTVTIEKEQRTLAGLLTSLLTPLQIWWGKFTAAMLYLILLHVSALPVLSLAFALGGIGWREVLLAAGTTMVVLASMSAIGLYCSTFFRRSVHATAVTYGVVIALTLLTFVATSIVTTLQAQAAMAGGEAQEESFVALTPMLFNPYYPVIASMVPLKKDLLSYPSWVLSLQVFVGLGCLATALALRNLERSGEQL